nr:unnamed protein product [Digitaria exilis]
MEQLLEALGRAVDAGKIRCIGLSNETPYGLMKFLQLSKDFQLHSKLLTVQGDTLKVKAAVKVCIYDLSGVETPS